VEIGSLFGDRITQDRKSGQSSRSASLQCALTGLPPSRHFVPTGIDHPFADADGARRRKFSVGPAAGVRVVVGQDSHVFEHMPPFVAQTH
jgi:hypothetical protein